MASIALSFNNVDLVSIDGGEPRTTSLAVAKKFGRRHSDILRSIRTANKNDDSFNPVKTKYLDKQDIYRPMYLLSQDEVEVMENRLMGHIRAPYGLRESVALSVIEQLLGVKLIRQYNVGGYRIDGYDAENNIAYEVDEDQHQVRSHKKSDSVRQRYIESEIGCKFVRVKV